MNNDKENENKTKKLNESDNYISIIKSIKQENYF